MTLLSCLALGLALAVAIALLVLAGVLIGCALPRGGQRRAGPRLPQPPANDPPLGSGESTVRDGHLRADSAAHVDPPERGG